MRRHETGSWEHPDDPGEPSTGVRRLSVTDTEAAILSGLAAGKMVIEIGTGLGVSTRALARWASVVYTIDVDEWVFRNIMPTLPENVTAVTDRAHFHAGKAFDLVFIDGDHSGEAVKADLRFARQLCRGLIVCHDAKAISEYLDGDWLHIATVHGLAVQHV